MNTMITDEAVEDRVQEKFKLWVNKHGYRATKTAWQIWKAAYQEGAATGPEAGNPVSVSEAFEAWWARQNPDLEGVCLARDEEIELARMKAGRFACWKAAWQASLAARQPVGEAVAYVVTPFRIAKDGSYENGPDELCFAEEADVYTKRCGLPLYAAPPAQQPALKVDVEDVLGKALDMAKGGAGAVGLVEWIAEQLIEEEE